VNLALSRAGFAGALCTCAQASGEADLEARWVKHNGRPGVHGFKDHAQALVEEVAVTPANVNDGEAVPTLCRTNRARCSPQRIPGQDFPRRRARQEKLAAGRRHRQVGRDEAETLTRLQAWNQPIHRIRGRIEKIFGTLEAQLRPWAHAMASTGEGPYAVRFTAIVYNIKRCSRILVPAGPPPASGRSRHLAIHPRPRQDVGANTYRTTGKDDPRPGLIIMRG
jgi:IS5 family transposase